MAKPDRHKEPDQWRFINEPHRPAEYFEAHRGQREQQSQRQHQPPAERPLKEREHEQANHKAEDK